MTLFAGFVHVVFSLISFFPLYFFISCLVVYTTGNVWFIGLFKSHPLIICIPAFKSPVELVHFYFVSNI